MNLNDTASVVVSGGDSLVISGVVANTSGSETLTVSGSGKLILGNNNNTYGPAAGSVGTILNGGILQVGSNGALGAGDVSFAGNGTLQSGAAGLIVTNNFAVNSGSIGTLDDNGNTFTLGGVIGGAGIYSKIGAGTLIVTNNNNFSGALNVTNGTLVLSGDNSGASGAVTNSATLQLANANAVGGSSVLALNSGSTLQLRADSSVSFSPSSLALQNASDTLNFDVNSLTGATGNTLTLSGALAFANNSSQSITVTGNSTYTLGLGDITLTATSHNPYFSLNVNTLPTGAGVVINSVTSGNYGNYLNLTGGGKVTITGNLGNTSNGSLDLVVNNGTTVTLQGATVKSGTANAYRYVVPNGTLVLDNSSALLNDTTGAGLSTSYFILGAATNVFGLAGTFSAPAGVLVATNNSFNAAVYLGDANNLSGGLSTAANLTNYVSDGDIGFTNSGIFTIGGQNTSGDNVYANPIILGLTPNIGKSVTLVAATGGEVDFANILANGTDQTAGVTVNDAAHQGLVKFTGVNTYGGNTTVNGGTLEVANANFSTNSTVTVTNGATLQLDFAGVNIVNALILNGVSKPAGTYNSGNTAYITGSGSLQVVPLAIPPVAGFSGSPTNIFVTQTVTFTNASTGSITNWVWNFGDGTSVTNNSNASVNHAYAVVGTNTVSLIVNGAGGSSTNTQVNYIVVKSKPVLGKPVLSVNGLILSGTNGPAGQQYRILNSTNVALPLSGWTPVYTNTFNPDGSYGYTNTPLTNKAGFLILVSP